MKATWIIGSVLTLALLEANLWALPPAKRQTGQTTSTKAAPAPARECPDNDTSTVKVSRRHRRKAETMFLKGAGAIEEGNPQAAERDFELAHKLDPNSRRYLISAEIAQQYIITQLVQRAQNEWSRGRRDDALASLKQALLVDPGSPTITQCIEAMATDVSVKAPALLSESRQAAEPIALTPQGGQRSFHLRIDKRNLIRYVLNAFGIRATVDQSVNAQLTSFDTDAIDFAQAADLLKLATDTLFIPLDTKSVMVVADTRDNRTKFERRVKRTFYFPALSPKELTDMESIARNVFGIEQTVLDPAEDTLTLRAPQPELDALDETFRELLGGRSVLQLEVRLYEVDRTKATNIGIVLPTSTTVFNVPSEINSILENNSSLVDQILLEYPSLRGNDEAILAALIASGLLTGTVFNSPFAVFGGGLTETGINLNGVSVNMLLNSSDARSLNQIQVRVLDQEEATIRSGERYPIMTSSFSSLASNSSSNFTIPQIQYEDLGLTLKVTPHVEFSNEVSLNLDMKLSSLAGFSLNDIPILANRQYSGIVSLRLGDSAILISDLSRQESLDITGVPGLSDLPGFSRTTNRQDTKDIMELAVVITPLLVRSAHAETEGPVLLLPHH